MTAPRRPRSAWLLVGSTPGTLAKVQRAGQPFSRFFAKLRWRRLRAALRDASSGGARAADDGLDGTARELGAEELAQKLCGVAPGDAVPDREGGDRRLQARAEGSRRYVDRQLGARHGAALRAAQALQAVLAEDDRG